ncbi:MAG TPA: hypothetical protein VE221_07945, partial [Sphingomicrobium sp.]|nr:hypothetical protein [Sphingomicrobium sp.]
GRGMIDVKQIGDGDPMRFEVAVTDRTATRHQVTMSATDFERLAQGRTPDELIDAAFRFLLDREPKESILRSFDVSVIGRYFPEFEHNLPEYLA